MDRTCVGVQLSMCSCFPSGKMATTRISSCVLHRLTLYNFPYIENCVMRKSIFSNFKSFSSIRPPNIHNSRKSSMLLGLAGISIGALVGAGYSYHKLQEARLPVMNDGMGTESMLLPSLPNIEPSRKVLIPTDNTGLKLTLYQYTTCPFCCKVRAYLDYYGFSYDVVEVNPVLRQQIKWSQYKKVPILLAHVEDGVQQLNDSSMIVSALTSFLHDQQQGLKDVVKCFPSISFKDDSGNLKSEIMNRYFLMFQGDTPKERTKENILQERKWRKWADDVLVHVLSPNVYRTREEALQAFNWFSQVGEWEKHFSTWERYLVIYVGAFAMWLIGKRLKKRHNLRDDVRESLYDECNFWVKTLKKQGTPFMGGNSPDLSDLAVYGVLNSIEGCDAFRDVLAHTKIGNWYQDMKEVVNNHKGSVAMSR